MSDLETTEGGIILVARRTKILCRWCGAAYEKRQDEDDAKALEGIRAHELQCRIGVRQRLLQAALSGPLTGKGGAAIVDTVDAVMGAVEAGERTSWKETI